MLWQAMKGVGRSLGPQFRVILQEWSKSYGNRRSEAKKSNALDDPYDWRHGQGAV